MEVYTRASLLTYAIAIVLSFARAHIASHDNILRIQLWDAEGLSREPIVTTPSVVTKNAKSKVNLDILFSAMLDESYDGSDIGRFTRHKVRHKRRRPRESSRNLPWSFHESDRSLNVAEFEGDEPWSGIEAEGESSKDASPPMTLRQDEDEEETIKKQLPVVPKCCASGQNLSYSHVNGQRVCRPTMLSFQPLFFQSNETHMWDYDSNVFETIVGNPCKYDSAFYLEPHKRKEDEFFLLLDGSIFLPNYEPYFFSSKRFCMETFWDENNQAGVTLPLFCFPEEVEIQSSSALVAYAAGMIISVVFLLATGFVYLVIIELRDTHGKALTCLVLSLAMAFSCLAATQLASDAFTDRSCSVIAYLIQFSFVSCFFWLNIMCFDTFLNVRYHIEAPESRRNMRKKFCWYCLYAVFVPLVLSIATCLIGVQPAVPSTYLKPNFGVVGCNFQLDQTALIFFYAPVAVILVVNLIIFFLTSRAFTSHYEKLKDFSALELTQTEFSTTDDWARLGAILGETLTVHDRASPLKERPVNLCQRVKNYRRTFRTCCLLTVIMGLSWMIEIVTWAANSASSEVSVWSIFDVINALQGALIFGIYVMQNPIRKQIKFPSICWWRRAGSELVVSERTSIDIGSTGRRDYV